MKADIYPAQDGKWIVRTSENTYRAFDTMEDALNSLGGTHESD